MKSKLYKCSISFFLSFACMTAIFVVLGLMGGRFSMFQGDDFQQYLVFIADFIKTLQGNGSIWYSFANYIGSGNILTVAYYCLSPFNILFYLCDEHFYLAYYLVVVLKLSFAAASFCFFIMRFTQKDKFYYVIASLFYALSGYAVILYLDIMWLDALYVLPILISLIVSYIDDNKYMCLIIVYAYLFITNFYMGFIVGVFSAVFFASYLLYKGEYALKGKVKHYIKKCLGYAGIVFLSIGICSGLLLAAAGFLSEHMAHDNVEFDALVANLLDIVNSMFIGEFQTMDNKVPLLYAGIPTFALVFFFFINKETDIKEKIFFGAQLLFYIVGMLILPVYKFLHAFDYPNFYGYRFSFVVVFLLTFISCIAIDCIDMKDIRFFKIFIVVAPLFYSFMMTLQRINFGGNRLNNQSGLLLNFVFMFLWFLILSVVASKEGKKKWVVFTVILVASAELVVNGYICIKNTDFVHIEKSLINGWYYAEKQSVDDIKAKDDSFYRIYINNDVNTNSGKMFSFNGLNTFSSADNYELRMALCRLGQSTSNRYLRSNCSLPGFDSLFGVKYRIDMPRFEDYIGADKIDSSNFMHASVEENEYALSLGYMVSPDILTYTFSNNAFDNIERLCAAMTGEQYDIYTNIALTEDNIVFHNYTMDVIDGRLYFTRVSDLFNDKPGVAFVVPEYSDDRYLEFSYDSPGSYPTFPTVYTDEEGAYHSKLMAEGGVYKMGKLNNDNYVTLATSISPAPNFFINAVNIADFSKEEFSHVFENLSSNQFDIVVNNEDYIVGTVVATEEKPYLFTTIPYDPEWHIYVDGKPVSKLYRVVGDAFMAIELTPGEHTVTFQYIEKWSNEGAIISLISISIFCILVLWNVLRKKYINNNIEQ